MLTVVLFERIFLRKVSHTFKSSLGGLYIPLKIIFLVWLFSISIDKDFISSKFIIKPLRSLYKSASRINITIPPPLQHFLIWCTGMYPSNWNKESWLILLSFAHVSVKRIIVNLVFKDLQKSWKASKFLFSFLMFRWRTENDSLEKSCKLLSILLGDK